MSHYGPNNESLPEPLRGVLHDLAYDVSTEDWTARQQELRRIQKAREFWKGNQYVYWSENETRWKIPTHSQLSRHKQPYKYVTNIYQAYGLTIIAALAQSFPRVRYHPQSASQQDDVVTADAASVLASYIERVNGLEGKLIDEIWHLWTDGATAAYVRYVSDAARFGTIKVPRVRKKMQQMSDDHFECPACDMDVPKPDGPDTPQDSTVCPQCDLGLGPENFSSAQWAETLERDGEDEVPAGGSVIDFVGKLELRLPPAARQMSDYPYLVWTIDLPRYKLQSFFPHVRDKIQEGSQESGSAQSSTERIVRLSLVGGGQQGGSYSAGTSLVSFSRFWLRPWVFESVKDKDDREQLKKLYPDGCYVAFAGDVYCESRNESMDDHWRILFALPGDGQNREALGSVLISVQERYNTAKNIAIETVEHGLSTLFLDGNLVSAKALEDNPMRPGDAYTVRRRSGEPLTNAFHQTNPLALPGSVLNESQEMIGSVSQFLTGAFPALFGGGALNTDTAAGYSMQRDQAMGRLNLIFRNLKQFHAEFMTLAIQAFKKNREEPVEVSVLGPSGKLDSKLIRLEDLSGQFYAYPEVDEAFPESFSMKKDAIMKLLESGSAIVTQALESSPNALRAVWKLIGIPDVKLPNDEARKKQYKEIQALLDGRPMPSTDGTGQPALDEFGAPVLQSSVSIDADYDDHQTHWLTIMEWIQSPEGQEEAMRRPEGYQNVRLHGLEHKAIFEQEQAKVQAQAAMPQGEQ